MPRDRGLVQHRNLRDRITDKKLGEYAAGGQSLANLAGAGSQLEPVAIAATSGHPADMTTRMLIIAAMSAMGMLLLGCQEGSTPSGQAAKPSGAGAESGAKTSYQRDLERICHSLERSGALEQSEGQRAMAVAYWLSNNIETIKGRQLLARINRAKPEGKVAILTEESKRMGMTSCPLAVSWGGGAKN